MENFVNVGIWMTYLFTSFQPPSTWTLFENFAFILRVLAALAWRLVLLLGGAHQAARHDLGFEGLVITPAVAVHNIVVRCCESRLFPFTSETRAQLAATHCMHCYRRVAGSSSPRTKSTNEKTSADRERSTIDVERNWDSNRHHSGLTRAPLTQKTRGAGCGFLATRATDAKQVRSATRAIAECTRRGLSVLPPGVDYARHGRTRVADDVNIARADMH